MNRDFDPQRNARESGFQNTPLFLFSGSAGAGSTDNPATLSQLTGPVRRFLDGLPTWAPFVLVGLVVFIAWKNR